MADTDPKAHLQKGRILAKDGDFTRATAALELCTGSKAEADARELLSAVSGAVGAASKARKAAEGKHWAQCIESASSALEVGSHSTELRELRLRCEEGAGDVDGVYGDLTYVFPHLGIDLRLLIGVRHRMQPRHRARFGAERS